MLEIVPLVAVLMLSPGPANLAALALASRHGLRRVGPFLAGVAIGYAGIAAVIAGFGGLLVGELPALRTALQTAGGLFIGYLGWRLIARAGEWADADRGPGLLSGLALQLLNPKFPAVVLTVLSASGTGSPWPAVGALVGMGLVGLGLYATLGAATHRFATSPASRAGCDRIFGLLLIATGCWLALAPFTGMASAPAPPPVQASG